MTEERIYYEILEYAKEVGKKFGEEVVPSNIPFTAEKKYTVETDHVGVVLINPFKIHRDASEFGVDWRDYVQRVVLHEHLHDEFAKKYPEQDRRIRKYASELRDLFIDKERGVLAVYQPLEIYIDLVLARELYPEYYEMYSRLLSKIREYWYAISTSVISFGIEQLVIGIEVKETRLHAIIILASSVVVIGRYLEAKSTISRYLPPEYSELFDEVLGIFRRIRESRDVKVLMELYDRYVELLKKYL